jgi:subtilisin-like proprotein convertase family protein
MTRRTLLGRSTVLMATSGLMLGLGAAAPLLAKKNKKKDKETEDEKKGAKTIVRKFSSDNAVVIDDNTTANPYPSTIQVSGIKKGKVIDVNVILRGLNHGFPDNIDAVLVAPGGASTVLMSDVGGGTDALSVTLTLDDEASASLPDATALENGAFKPANFGAGADTYPQLGVAPTEANLSQLDGGNPNGEWRLFVLDDANGSTGAYSGGWDLELTIKLEKKKKKNKKKKDAKLDEK